MWLWLWPNCNTYVKSVCNNIKTKWHQHWTNTRSFASFVLIFNSIVIFIIANIFIQTSFVSKLHEVFLHILTTWPRKISRSLVLDFIFNLWSLYVLYTVTNKWIRADEQFASNINNEVDFQRFVEGIEPKDVGI